MSATVSLLPIHPGEILAEEYLNPLVASRTTPVRFAAIAARRNQWVLLVILPA